MSQQDVEIVRRAYDAYSRGEYDEMVQDFSPDCEYIASGAIPGTGGVYPGPEGYKQFLMSFSEEFDGIRIAINEVVEVGGRILVSATLTGRGKRSGAETDWHIWQVWELREGKFVRGQGFRTRAEALEAAGLSE